MFPIKNFLIYIITIWSNLLTSSFDCVILDFLRELRGQKHQSSDDEQSSDGSQDQTVPNSRASSSNTNANGNSSSSRGHVREPKSNSNSNSRTDSARPASGSNTSSNGTASASSDYTQEQVQEVQRYGKALFGISI